MALTSAWPNPDQTIAAGGIDTAAGNQLSETYFDRVGGMLLYLAGTTGVITTSGVKFQGLPTGGTSTTSTSPVDIVDTSATITTNGGTIFAWATISASVTTGQQAIIAMNIGGADVTDIVIQTPTVTTVCLIGRATGLAAGTHTVKLRWSVNAGTVSRAAHYSHVMALEFRR